MLCPLSEFLSRCNVLSPLSPCPPARHVQKRAGVEGRERGGCIWQRFCHPMHSLFSGSEHLTYSGQKSAGCGSAHLRRHSRLHPLLTGLCSHLPHSVPSVRHPCPIRHACPGHVGCIGSALSSFLSCWGIPGNPLPLEVLYFCCFLDLCQHFACPIWVLLSLPLVLKPHSGCHYPSSFWCWRKVERQDILTVTGLL